MRPDDQVVMTPANATSEKKCPLLAPAAPDAGAGGERAGIASAAMLAARLEPAPGPNALAGSPATNEQFFGHCRADPCGTIRSNWSK
jgi:hypothetical protein